MTEIRMDRHLSIWGKVAECEQMLEKITRIDDKVDKLITLERLIALKRSRGII